MERHSARFVFGQSHVMHQKSKKNKWPQKEGPPQGIGFYLLVSKICPSKTACIPYKTVAISPENS